MSLSAGWPRAKVICPARRAGASSAQHRFTAFSPVDIFPLSGNKMLAHVRQSNRQSAILIAAAQRQDQTA
jgi:hypothetical protein